jgi:hypothetical protein
MIFITISRFATNGIPIGKNWVFWRRILIQNLAHAENSAPKSLKDLIKHRFCDMETINIKKNIYEKIISNSNAAYFLNSLENSAGFPNYHVI